MADRKKPHLIFNQGEANPHTQQCEVSLFPVAKQGKGKPKNATKNCYLVSIDRLYNSIGVHWDHTWIPV